MKNVICQICNENISKYTCPACQLRTCSLKCSTLHKSIRSCTGKIDPTSYVSRQQLLTNSNLNRDYNYLLSINRKVELARNDAHSRKLTANSYSPFHKQKGGTKRSSTFVYPDVEKNSQRYSIINDVKVYILPPGMERAVKNKSGWNNKRRKFYWTVEWMFVLNNQQEKIPLNPSDMQSILSTIPDSTLLQEGLQNALKTVDGSIPISSAWKPYLKAISSASKKPVLIPLTADKSLAENLVSQEVVEFPTIIVIDGDQIPDGYSKQAVPSSGENNDSSSSGSSSSDIDSDSSDDDDATSDEDRLNEKGSEESDSPPEESSSKR